MNALSNIDILEILSSKNIKINGVFSKDELPKELKHGWYVINLQDNDDGDGTHWTCFNVGSQNIYFDSFGIIYPEIVEEKLKNIIYNRKEIQDFKSSSCGWFCIGLIYTIQNQLIKNDKKYFYQYINRFSKLTYLNDELLGFYLNECGFNVQ